MPTKPLPQIFTPQEIVDKRVRLYANGKHAALTAAMQLTDSTREETKWVWYSIEQVRTWLEEMDDLGADGIRIYFGEKEIEEGDENDLAAQAQKASGQLCLVLVLTRRGSGDDIHVNVDYENEPDFGERHSLYLAKRPGKEEKQFNFGGYCPPLSVTEGSDYPNESIS